MRPPLRIDQVNNGNGPEKSICVETENLARSSVAGRFLRARPTPLFSSKAGRTQLKSDTARPRSGNLHPACVRQPPLCLPNPLKFIYYSVAALDEKITAGRKRHRTPLDWPNIRGGGDDNRGMPAPAWRTC
jgi:hypothetical protein